MAYVGKKPQPFYLGQVDDLTVAGNANITGATDIDTSLNVDGTVTSDGLTVDGNIKLDGNGRLLQADKNVSGTDNILFYDNSTSDNNLYVGRDSSNVIVRTGNANRLRVASNGGVSVGNRAPDQLLQVYGATPFIDFYDTTDGTWDEGDVFSGINFRTADPSGSGAGATHAFIKSIHTRSGTGHSNPDAGLSFGVSQGSLPVATEEMRLNTLGRLQFNSGYGSVATAYGVRAWCNFNGEGTVSLRGTGNVSSITDNGTGDYTVNFANSMPDANYAPVLTQGGLSTAFKVRYKSSGFGTGSFVVVTENDSDSAIDTPYVSVVVLR